MSVVVIAVAPAVLWLGYFGWRMVDRRRYWDADRVEARRRRPPTGVAAPGAGLGNVAGLSSAAGLGSGVIADGGGCDTGGDGGCGGS